MSDIPSVAALISAEKWHDAQTMVNNVLEREPANADGWFLKGIVCLRLNDFATAINCFNQALQIRPNFKDAAINLGRALTLTGQLNLAVKVYEHLLNIDRGNPVTPAMATTTDPKAIENWFRKGEACMQQGDFHNAAEAFRHVLSLHPDLPEALINLGLALHRMRQCAEADGVLLYALRIQPNNPHALNILAGNYAVSGDVLRAIAVWRQLVALHPDHYEALLNMAKAFSNLEMYADAVKAYEQVLVLRPHAAEILMELLHMLSRLCRWDKTPDVMRRLQAALQTNPQWVEQFLVSVHLPQMQLKNARRYVQKFYPGGMAYDAKRTLPAEARGSKKLRIGYISSDFYQHATTYLISELFEQHDREKFEVFAYSYSRKDTSAERGRVEKSVDQFRDIQFMGDGACAHLIREDGIDILIDLKGYTTGSRLGFLASRPAPVQMHYLGHPGTTGAPFMDYFIADPVTAPPEADEDFSEKLIRLPHCYQINDRKRPLPLEGPSREAYGLPPYGLVFCDFNNAYKVTPEVFAVWMRLLRAVPGSVLWLYETHAEATQNMRAQAQKEGVAPARLIAARPAPLAHHLARYQHVDVFLDSFPVCGHTTASDALWCAVPVVTMAGKPFISRVAASLLHAVELPELVTQNLEEYETLALELARNDDKRNAIRTHLQQGRMRFPLFDSLATTRALEAAYMHAAQCHRNGAAPESFRLAPDLGIL